MKADFTIDPIKPRSSIHRMLAKGEVEQVLWMAGILHGHYCPGLALGVKAVSTGFAKLGITDNTGMEEIMAVVECNSCFADGIQFAAGCTLGNNALVYKDLGKTAVTFYRRGKPGAVRLCVKSYDLPIESDKEKEEGNALFDKAVKRREKCTDAENVRLKELWNKRSFAVINASPDLLFDLLEPETPVFEFAPIFDSQTCSICGEKIMETKALLRNGRPCCLTCGGGEYRMVVGKGISTGKSKS